MQTCLDEKKATQIAAYFLDRAGGTIDDFIKLIKLLYIADREALRDWGYPLTGDAYYSLEYGPIVSKIKDLITDDPQFAGATIWNDHIARVGDYGITLKSAAGADSLSCAEMTLVARIYDECGDMDTWELVKMAHTFGEWKNPQGSRIEITYEDILKAVGKEESVAKQIAREIESGNLLSLILKCH